MVKCRICKKNFEQVTYWHIRAHGLTVEQYKKKYPGAQLMSDRTLKKKSDDMLRRHADPKSGLNSRSRVKKISKSVSKLWEDGRYRRNQAIKRKTSDFHKKLSKATKRNWSNPKCKYNSNEYHGKLSRSAKKVWDNKSEKEKLAIINRWQGNNNGGMTKPEKKVSYLLRYMYPGDFRYNGDGRQGFSVFGHPPDFINVNGKKQAIEVFGCYWHACKVCGFDNRVLKDGTTARQTIIRDSRNFKRLADIGWSTLIVWEHELKDRDQAKRILARV
jgi:G:T-mismatch repair DNA endonuclease (very short patch repair protein)